MTVERRGGKWVGRVKWRGCRHFVGAFGSEEAARVAVREEEARLRDGTSSLIAGEYWMTIESFAKRINVRSGTVKRWAHEGMPVKRVDRHVLINPSEADAWVKTHRASSVAFERVSVIYIARRETDGAIKIGWSSDVPRRMHELRKSGAQIALVAAFPGDKPVELRLHNRFAAFRIDGEWFRSSPEFDAFVKKLSKFAA